MKTLFRDAEESGKMAKAQLKYLVALKSTPQKRYSQEIETVKHELWCTLKAQSDKILELMNLLKGENENENEKVFSSAPVFSAGHVSGNNSNSPTSRPPPTSSPRTPVAVPSSSVARSSQPDVRNMLAGIMGKQSVKAEPVHEVEDDGEEEITEEVCRRNIAHAKTPDEEAHWTIILREQFGKEYDDE